MQQASSEPAPLTVALNDDGDRMSLEGALDIRTLAVATRSFKKWRTKHKSRVLDLGKLRNLIRRVRCFCAAFETRAWN